MKLGYQGLLGLALVAGILIGAAFGGGVVYGRNHVPPSVAAAASLPAAAKGTAAAGTPAAGTPAAATPATRGGGTRGGGAGGAGAAANPLSGGLQGAIESVSGGTLSVRTTAGTVQQVMVGPDTHVQALQPGSASDLRPGTVILVQGESSGAGVLTAGTITITAFSPSAGRDAGPSGTAVSGAPTAPAGSATRSRPSATAAQ